MTWWHSLSFSFHSWLCRCPSIICWKAIFPTLYCMFTFVQKKKKPHSKYGISVCVWIHQWSILSPANRNVYSSFSMHVCSVMLDSLQPSGLKAAKLLCPWGFPGKDTGVGWHFLLQGILPELGIEPRTPAPPALAVGFLTTVPLGKALPLLCASTNTCLSKKTVWKNELHSFKKN